jgi:5-aminolevulinate synthase
VQIATAEQPSVAQAQFTVWCSNDYLGMGQHPKVIAAMQRRGPLRRGRRRHAQHLRHQPLPRASSSANSPTCTARKAALLFTSGYVSNEASLGTLGACCPAGHLSDD